MASRGDFGYGAVSEFHDDPSMPSRPIGSGGAPSGLPAPFAELSEQVGADIFAIGNHAHSLNRVASQINEDADIPAIKAEIGGLLLFLRILFVSTHFSEHHFARKQETGVSGRISKRPNFAFFSSSAY